MRKSIKSRLVLSKETLRSVGGSSGSANTRGNDTCDCAGIPFSQQPGCTFTVWPTRCVTCVTCDTCLGC